MRSQSILGGCSCPTRLTDSARSHLLVSFAWLGETLPLAFSICLGQQSNSVGLCCCLLNGFVCFHPLCVWEGSPLILVILHGRQRLCCYLCALTCLLNNTIPTLSYCNFCSLTEAGSSGQLSSRHWRVPRLHGTGRPRIPFPSGAAPCHPS